MERKHFLKAVAFATLMPGLLIGCAADQQKQADGQQQTYTCPMHPQIIQHAPSTCPICGMDLVLFDKNNKEASLTLSERQIALAGITTVVAGEGSMERVRRLAGRLTTDPERTAVVSTRAAGRLEKLYVRETGVRVSKGQPLYRLYSEELETLQRELLLAVEQARQFPNDANFARILRGAKQKLLLYGQSESQLQALTASGKVNPWIEYPAPIGGVVSELSVAEGQYVAEGATLLRLEDYSRLWVEADAYPAEAALVKEGQQVQVLVAGSENKPVPMTVQFVYPALRTGSQVLPLRGAITNPDMQWQPGMQAVVLLPEKSTGGVLQVPSTAVLRDGKGAHVWLQTGKDVFVPKNVQTGMEDAGMIEIRGGLNGGERVVVTGAYLLYSEYVLKKGAHPAEVSKDS
ncbi:efflux RND transporter periplasmic adaptor subunit [Chitinophaga lutea]